MAGEAAVNLESGAFNVSLNGLTPLQTYTVWLVDRTEIECVPPLPDTVFGLVTFLATGPSALLTGLLPLNLPLGFTIDRVVVAPGLLSGAEALAAGTVNVFQKIFFRRLSLVNESTGAVLFEETTPAPPLVGLVPDLAAETDAAASLDGLMLRSRSGLAASRRSSTSRRRAASSGRIREARQAHLARREALFRGDVQRQRPHLRHLSSRQQQLHDRPAFIATLPANDPLFVAEFNPALAQLERPALMRQFGLILENLDGLSNPTTKFVMRGVPHTLGLQVSLETGHGLVPAAPAEMTGWSGDGAPGTGSLREFAIGAVTQHFTKSLNRVEGTDFKLPNEHQLDAMEAFQLSLGRDDGLRPGQDHVHGRERQHRQSRSSSTAAAIPNFGGTCNFCHTNAGALSASLRNQNRNFNTNVEDMVHPARSVLNFPMDGGFGRTANGDGTFGNRTFNTPSVVEAADTAPFFHNNVVEHARRRRARSTPDPNSTTRERRAHASTSPTTQNDQIADFLRGINTLQNIDVARRELQEILANNGNPRREQDTRLQTAFEETQRRD